MTPKYALSLSFEGIGLMARHATGWSRVAEVALDDPALETAIADMRAKVPDNGAVRLVIPNEQIRYLDIADPGDAVGARASAAETVLEGATPYAVSDLVIDWQMSGDRLFVAAVAKDTLAEAEAFAQGHQFTPTAFVARPPKGQFPKEVLFGAPEGWTGPPPQRDMLGLVITSTPPGPAPASNPAPDPIAQTDPAPGSESAKVSDPPVAEADVPVAATPDADGAESPTEPAPIHSDAAEPDAPPPSQPAMAGEPTDEAAPEVVDAPDSAPQGTEPDPVNADTPVSQPTGPEAATDNPDATPPSATPVTPAPDAPAKADTDIAAQSDHVDPVTPDAPPIVETPASTVAEDAPGNNVRADAEAANDDTAALAPGAADPAPSVSIDPPPAPTFAHRFRDSIPAGDTAQPPTDPPKTDLDSAAPPVSLSVPQPQAAPAVSAFSSIRASRSDAPTVDVPKLGAATASDAEPTKAPRVPTVPTINSGVTAPAVQAPLEADPARPGPADNSTPAKGGFFSRRRATATPAAPAPAAQVEPVSKSATVTPQAQPDARVAANMAARLRAKALASTPVRDDAGPRAPVAPTGEAATMVAGGPQDERDRMTIFGARHQNGIGGKPRFLGLILTAALLLFLAGVAAWASVFLDNGLARFFAPDRPTAIADLPPVEEVPVIDESQAQADPDVEIAALETETTATDVPLAPLAPLAQVDRPGALSEDEANATYAATGIWQRAPVAPAEPGQTNVDDVYVASIDGSVEQLDAVALPQPLQNSDPTIAEPRPSIGPGITFDLDERGLVRATPEGALNPDGVRIFAGLPPVVAPNRPADARLPVAPDSGDDPEAAPAPSPLSQFRPTLRPGNLIETNERATLSGISRSELQQMRPRLRPETEKQQDEEDQASISTDQAIERSRTPIPRPRNFAAVVRQAEANPQPAPEPVQVASVAPRSVSPRIPSSASVAREATVRNQLNLRRLNLIGVYGKTSSRRALVRLANGRYQKVKVGDRVDGGRVTAIGEGELRYSKGGRNLVLKMPKG